MDAISKFLQTYQNKKGEANEAKTAILTSMKLILELQKKVEAKAKTPAELSEFLEKCVTAKSKPRLFQQFQSLSEQIQKTRPSISQSKPEPRQSKPEPRQPKLEPGPYPNFQQQTGGQITIQVNLPNQTVTSAGAAKRRKETIPKSIKEKVWYTYMGKQRTEGICPCCLSEPIKIMHFHAGHVISEANGGKATLDNLRPICGRCNLQMGAMNMNEYMMKFYGRYLV
jgi:hypothetical protein